MEGRWETLAADLDPKIIKCIREDFHFQYMTPVQSATIPLFTKNKDVAVEAITGSGKTLAFLVPVIHMLLKREEPLKKKQTGALVITPTRELAIQISEVLTLLLTRFKQFSQLLLIGGSTQSDDALKFKEQGCNIIVGTPGRLVEAFDKTHLGFNLTNPVKSLEVLVLDEADRLLDMGFETSVNTILSYLPKQRRTGLFSATQTDQLEELVRAGLRNPMKIQVKEKHSNSEVIQKTPSLLQNYYFICDADQKLNYLTLFLRARRKEKIMIFFSTCAGVEYFTKAITNLVKNVTVLSLHGKMKGKRNSVFNKFRPLDSGILTCTDVMARGVDIPVVHWVVQYDPPSRASSFVHRCGRTARIGRTGSALVFLLPNEDTYIKFLAVNQKVPLEQYKFEETEIPNVLSKVQKLSMRDRAVMDKGMRAFVAYVQSYAKHECSYIFKVKELNFCALARGFGLLKMPRMPELRGRDVSSFQPAQIDFDSIRYLDKPREQKRQRLLQEGADGKNKKNPKKMNSWSINKTKQDRKKKRKETKKRKKDDNVLDETEMKELEDDTRMMKKLRKGMISESEFAGTFEDKSAPAKSASIT